MADVSNDWDVIQLSFAEPDSVSTGNVHFNRCPTSECSNVESDADFLAAIKAKQAAGKKILISIGGANGEVQLTSTSARDAFVNSVSAIIDKWNLDGLDVDFEGHSLYLSPGDNDFKNPTTPVVANLISALKTLKAKYGANFLLTMAPETLLTQGGYSFWGSGKFGGADSRNGVYLAVLYGVRDFLTFVNVQDYNSGAIAGSNGTYYNSGNVDFNVALTDMMITGFPIEHVATNVWPGLRADQVGFGLPANGMAAGSGQLSTGDTQKAFDCLMTRTNCGSYVPSTAHPTVRSIMTWSINWDKFNNFEFSKAHGAYFRSLGN